MVHKSVAEILNHHVTFELEAIDRMYLNAYVPSLQTGAQRTCLSHMLLINAAVFSNRLARNEDRAPISWK